MSEQPYNGLPPWVDTDTSHAAAVSMEESAGTLRATVLKAIREAGGRGYTDEELQEQLDMPANTERPRRRELFLRNLIRASGERRTTRSGRQAAVWVVA